MFELSKKYNSSVLSNLCPLNLTTSSNGAAAFMWTGLARNESTVLFVDLMGLIFGQTQECAIPIGK